MELKSEKIIAYCAAIALLVIGIVCYAALPEKPEDPIRIMFQSTGGKVLFSHNIHTSEDYYGFDCIDCHHYWEEDPEVKPVLCTECHMIESDDEDVPKRSDALHQQCMGCHEENSGGPVECTSCHVL
jgi:hypothetical protein